MALLPLTAPVADAAAQHFGSMAAARSAIDRDRLPERPAPSGARSKPAAVEHRVVSLSDVHIAAGKNPLTGRLDPVDDFKPDKAQQFLRLLAREWLAAAKPAERRGIGMAHEDFVDRVGQIPWRGNPPVDVSALRGRDRTHRLTLNLNGDFFEFLQVTQDRPGLRFPDRPPDGHPVPHTPANAIVKLNLMRQGHPEVFRALALHLWLGHDIHLLPGNHDRELWNPHVFQGSLDSGSQKVFGLTGLLREELLALGASEAEAKAALGRLRRLPFAVYGDAYVDHGHHEDRYNLTRRPFGELYEPTALHREMPMALGDYGVRDGFDALERKRPYIGDAITSPVGFAKEAIGAPRTAGKMFLAYLRSALKEGHEHSAERDAEVRAKDARGLVARFPELVEQLNAFRSPDDQLSADDVARGLERVEKTAAEPFFSSFSAGAGFFQRLPGILKGQAGRAGSKALRYEKRLEALHQSLGVNTVLHGHTHVAKDQNYLTKDARRVRYVNTHTWVDQSGRWDRAGRTWGQSSRGVGVIELGTGPDGQPWSEVSLMRVTDPSGRLVPGDIIEEPEVKAEAETAKAWLDRAAPGGSQPVKRGTFASAGPPLDRTG